MATFVPRSANDRVLCNLRQSRKGDNSETGNQGKTSKTAGNAAVAGAPAASWHGSGGRELVNLVLRREPGMIVSRQSSSLASLQARSILRLNIYVGAALLCGLSV